MTETITGELTAHRIVGEDFWSIATLRTRDRGSVQLTGKLLGVTIGDSVSVEGMWTTHPKFGEQFKVKDAIVVLPSSDVGVVAWISSKLKHVGPERAREMLRHFGGADALWKTIETDPNRLTEISGITPARVVEICEAYATFHADRDRMIRFKRWGLTDGQIAKVLARWGDETEDKMKANPYSLAEFVDGFGFIKADAVAQKMGVPQDAQPRVQCGLQHAMKEAAGFGHCFVPSGKLVTMAADKVLRIDSAIVAKELAIMRKAGDLVQHGSRTFLRKLDFFEGACADRINAMLSQRAVPLEQRRLEKDQDASGSDGLDSVPSEPVRIDDESLPSPAEEGSDDPSF